MPWRSDSDEPSRQAVPARTRADPPAPYCVHREARCCNKIPTTSLIQLIRLQGTANTGPNWLGTMASRTALFSSAQTATAFLVLLTVVALGCGDDNPTEPDGEGVLGEWVWSNGIKRTYSLHLPPSYDGSEPAALVVLYHGAGGTGSGFQLYTGMDSVSDQFGFITVYPDGIDNIWGNIDIEFTKHLTEHLESRLTIDPTRIYVTGFSNGGRLAVSLACALSDILAGAASVAAAMSVDDAAVCFPSDPIPVLFLHGTEDPTFPWDGIPGELMSISSMVSKWRRLDFCGPVPFTEDLEDRFDDGTRVWLQSYTDCAAGSEVSLYGIEGGGHTWPGTAPGLPERLGRVTYEIGNREILEFFARHSSND
jgi:polyhydroxybutyrate depolymerase